ncbi:MAG TPA: dihydrolipoyllysine-residue acetyltransferase [Woeseiaceae bacterium]|nr:dihydrolipoyllysine-residue acetyltransferase [Woeseiaceae bacterium]
MAESIDIVVPDLGDFADVEVIEVLVAKGDDVEKEAGLVTLETDKAAMDVPAPAKGVIESLTVEVGSKVNAGDVIGRMRPADGGGPDEPGDDEDAEKAAPAGRGAGAGDRSAETGETTVLADPEEAPRRSAGVETLVVPDLGDFEEVEIIEVHISAGDDVAVDDSLVTLETDKAAMDVPATSAGTVREVLVAVGDKVSAGTSIAMIDVAGQTGSDPGAGPGKAAAGEDTPEADRTAMRPAPVRSPEKTAAQPAQKTASAAKLPPVNEAGFAKAHASPSVRKLARELGVDLGQVKGSGRKNRVLHEDVKAFVKAILTGQAPGPAGGGLPKTPSVDFAKFGEFDLEPLTRIQKISGPRLQASWINIPHVTQHDEADITELENRRQELKGPAKERGIPLTPLAFVMKACVAALTEFPKVNASLADDGENLVVKKYIHLGFAADTEQGLVVPVIRDADKKDVYELASELRDLSQAARDGKLKAPQLQGASFTISSLGGIGGTAFTPIVNAPEVAILGVSRSSMKPVWDGEAFKPRLMLPLSLSYDHRVVDGAMAVRFTTFLCEKLKDVETLLQAIP